jgi:hypothetical protein
MMTSAGPAPREPVPARTSIADLREMLRASKDEATVRRVANSAWHQVVGSGRYTYAGFVREVERQVIDPAAAQCSARLSHALPGWELA